MKNFSDFDKIVQRVPLLKWKIFFRKFYGFCMWSYVILHAEFSGNVCFCSVEIFYTSIEVLPKFVIFMIFRVGTAWQSISATLDFDDTCLAVRGHNKVPLGEKSFLSRNIYPPIQIDKSIWTILTNSEVPTVMPINRERTEIFQRFFSLR